MICKEITRIFVKAIQPNKKRAATLIRLKKMKAFSSTKIRSILGTSKLIVEIPHQRPAFIYDTNLKMTDFVSESRSRRLRDDLRDNSHYFVCTTLGELRDAYHSTTGHQAHRRQSLIKKWCAENITGPQYLWLFEERKHNDN